MNFEPRMSNVVERICPADLPSLFHIAEIERTFAAGAGVRINQLDIPAGCIFAILGPTGSGKSTLLNLLGGLEVPKSCGPNASFKFSAPRKETVDLLRGRGLGAAAAYVGFVFQSGHLMRDATVSVNLAVSPAAARLAIISASIEALCCELDLRQGITSSRARVLSGGEAQRVAVGRALLRNPEVIIADEPTASLDPTHGTEVMGVLAAWQQRAGRHRSIVWVTHNYEEAAKFADKVIVLRGGTLAAGFQKCRDNPRDPLVLQAWVDGHEDRCPNPATVSRVSIEASKALERQVIDGEAAEREPVAPVRWSRLAVASKLAASELLSSPVIDGDKSARLWLDKLTSFSDDRLGFPEAVAFMREAIGWRFAGIIVAVVLAVTAASGILLPWHGVIFWIASILASAAAIAWPLVRRVEGLGQVAVYTVLLIAIAGLEQGRRLLDASFVRKLNTPELSHFVLNGTRFGEQLTSVRLAQIGCDMERRGLAVAVGEGTADDCEPRREIVPGAPFPPNNTIFGRWDTRGIAVARRSNRSSLEAEEACSSAQSIGNFAAIVADPSEPVFRMIGTDVVSPDGNALTRVGSIDLTRGPNEHIPLIGASRAFVVNALDFRNDATRDPFVCVKFKNWRLVRIAHVLDQLPGDGETEYQMLFPPPLHFEAVRERYESPKVQERMTAAYDSIAIYLRPNTAEAALQYVSDLAGRRENPGGGITAETGFKKIRAAIEGWTVSRGIGWAAIIGALGLSAMLIVVSMVSRITENDKALCVMRAFGMRFADVFLFVWLQAVVFFIAAGAAGLVITYFGWPLIVPRVADTLGLDASTVGPGSVLLPSYSGFAVVLTVSCIAATFFWWRQSKHIAQRLQRLA